MACEILLQITELVQPGLNEVPISEDVTDKIMEFVESLSNRGYHEREKALECGAYTILCNAWAQCCYSGMVNVICPGPGVGPCTEAVLRALYMIVAVNPEIMDEIGWQILVQTIDKNVSEDAHILALRLSRNLAMHSEANREAFTWKYGLMVPLISLIIKDTPSSELVQEWCATVKALILTDDPNPSVDSSRAPERKQLIQKTKVLPVVAGLLSRQEYEEDEDTLKAIVVFLGTMAVNENVCLAIESGHVLPGIYSILSMHSENMILVQNTISLLRYLCVDNDVRRKCSSYAFMKTILEALDLYRTESDLLINVTMSCLAMLTLQNACQTSQFVKLNGLPLTLQIMKDYKNDITILKGACFTLRNVCENGGSEARSQLKGTGFLPFLNELLVTHPDLTEPYLIPVLQDFSDSTATDEPSTEADPSTFTSAELLTNSQDVPPPNTEDTEHSHPSEDLPEGPFGEALEENILVD